MRRSCSQKCWYMDTIGLMQKGKSWRQKSQHKHNHDDPQIPQLRLRFAKKTAKQTSNGARAQMFFFLVGALCLSAGYHLRLTRGPAGNRTTTGSLSAIQECRHTNWAMRTPGARAQRRTTTHKKICHRTQRKLPLCHHSKTCNRQIN